MSARELAKWPLHLDAKGGVRALPEFTGDMAWYEAYGAATAADGPAGRLVSVSRFDAPWDSWEMHPEGDEIVVCLEGRITLIQEDAAGATSFVTLSPGEYAVNPAGVWHTADVDAAACALFVTAGAGTQGRARAAS
jgi:mannose-6-phosphate isomerase-like protein (cupin superfamily)